ESRLADFRADTSTCIDIAAKRSFRVRIIRGHALVAAAPRVGIRGFADFGLRGILKFSAARQGNKIHPGAGGRDARLRGFWGGGHPKFSRPAKRKQKPPRRGRAAPQSTPYPRLCCR